eukprot:jgi/Galph1/2958/GphlegSOOS_G1628.1
MIEEQNDSEKLLSSIEAKRKVGKNEDCHPCTYSRSQGDTLAYLLFLNQLCSSDGTNLAKMVQAVVRNVSKIQPELDELLFHCLELDWGVISKSEEVFLAFSDLIRTVTTLHVNYVEPVIASLTRAVVSKQTTSDIPKENIYNVLSTRAVVYEVSCPWKDWLQNSEKPLELLETVIEYYPTSYHLVYRSVLNCAPHKRRSVDDHIAFIHGALLLSRKIPEIRQRLVFLLTEKLVEIDAEASQTFSKDLPLSFENGKTDCTFVDIETSTELEETRQKMDELMKEVINFIYNLSRTGEHESYFGYFVEAFVYLIMPLIHLRHTPFLIVALSASSSERAESLIQKFTRIFTNRRNSENMRISSLKFCTSMHSYFRVLKNDIVIHWLYLIVNWLHDYIESYEHLYLPMLENPELEVQVDDWLRSDDHEMLDWSVRQDTPTAIADLEQLYSFGISHRLFYEVFYCVVYVLLKRGSSLLHSDESDYGSNRGYNVLEKLRSFRLARILRCYLSPLLFIPEKEAKEFIYWAFSLSLFDCRDLLPLQHHQATVGIQDRKYVLEDLFSTAFEKRMILWKRIGWLKRVNPNMRIIRKTWAAKWLEKIQRRVAVHPVFAPFISSQLSSKERSSFLHLVLSALSKLYGLGILLHRTTYRYNWLKTSHLHLSEGVYSREIFTISVGNFTWGGTGKTPFVVYLAELFSSRGYTPVALSRGYGNEDEGKLFQNRKILVGTGKNRQKALQNALKSCYPGKQDIVAIVDDGLQHWRVISDLNILMINAALPFGINGHLLPLGTLRESPLECISRASVVALHHSNQVSKDKLQKLMDWLYFRYPQIPLVTSYLEPQSLLEVSNDKKGLRRHSLQKLSNRCTVVCCGIAYPQGFLRAVIDYCQPKVAILESFVDHHWFVPQDLVRIVHRWKPKDDELSIVITEKDYYRNPSLFHDFSMEGVRLYALEASLQIGSGNDILIQKIIEQKGLPTR